MSNLNKFTLLYDGHCPLCSKEIEWLRKRDQHQAIKFQDIHEPEFIAKSPIALETLMAQIHGIDQKGDILVGIDVFEVVYSLVGLNFLAAPLRWPLTRPVMKILYWFFAKSRPLVALITGKTSCNNGKCLGL